MKNTKKLKNWLRVAAKLSLLFTEPKVRAAIGDRLKEHLDDVTDSVSGKYVDVSDNVAKNYQEAVDRLDAATSALQGKNYWISRVTGFALGVGVGAGLGILLAPATGRETRESVRDKVTDVKNKVYESAASATGKVRHSVTSMPSTGTQG